MSIVIPKTSPIFIDDRLKTECKKLDKEQNNMNRFSYIKLVEQELKSHIDMIFPNINVIQRADSDSKHRSYYALNNIDELFCERIKPDEEAGKRADIYLVNRTCMGIY
jgi:hypothetical protein